MRHIFLFEHGEELTTMGAVWFVSYCWYNNIDKNHLNWQRISTFTNRISVYNSTKGFHKYYLQQILCMNENRLTTNRIGLQGDEVIEMAKKLLNYF